MCERECASALMHLILRVCMCVKECARALMHLILSVCVCEGAHVGKDEGAWVRKVF